MVSSTAAAGTINHIARGLSSFVTRSCRDELPVAFSCTSSFTAFGDMSKTTHRWLASEKPSHHVCSHPSKTDHSKLHGALLPIFYSLKFVLMQLSNFCLQNR